MAESLGISSPIVSPGRDHRSSLGGPTQGAAPRADNQSESSAADEPSTQLDLGTTIEAIVRGPAPDGVATALAIGTRLLLRIRALPSAPTPGLFVGRILDSAGTETLVATSLGVFALLRRLALPAGSLIAFERIEQLSADADTIATPSTVGSWPALDEALTVLDQASPALAAQFRNELMPSTAAELTGSLLFLLGAVYRGNWPGGNIIGALAGSGHVGLATRLIDNTAELKRLGANPVTGDWQVYTLPFVWGAATLPVRLFIRRPKPGEEGMRFAVEIELSPLGPLQFDSMLRDRRLILVVRSHHSLPRDLCQAASDAFRRALPDWGMTGDISFATQARFMLDPLSSLRKHVAVTI